MPKIYSVSYQKPSCQTVGADTDNRFNMTRCDALCSNVNYVRRKFMNGRSKCPSAVTYRDACDVTRGSYVTRLSTKSTEKLSNVELTTLAV